MKTEKRGKCIERFDSSYCAEAILDISLHIFKQTDSFFSSAFSDTAPVTIFSLRKDHDPVCQPV